MSTSSGQTRLAALELLDLVLDQNSFRRWDGPIVPVTADAAYRADLIAAAERSGVDESVVTGEGLLGGHRVAVVVGEFQFLAGSVGVAAAERIVAAVERATAERLPLLAATSSGGTRMQEGTVAFVQMLKITAAVAEHKAAGLPYLVYLRHPTTGGVTATWGSLGHLTAAEPGALIGFLGPRVYEAVYGEPFPDVQRAEKLWDRGIIDAVVAPEGLRSCAARVLDLIQVPSSRPASPPDADLTGRNGQSQRPAGSAGPAGSAAAAAADVPTWEAVTRSRDRDRPGVLTLLAHGVSDWVRLSGTGEGERHPGIVLALARFADQSHSQACVLVGQDRSVQYQGQLLGPGALREARRGIRLAGDLGLPLVTVVDTPGAELSVAAEQGALAGEVARCLTDLMSVRTPVVSVLMGEGGGGGALALLPADLTIATQHSWLSPLPPEGASAIVHRTADRAAQMATKQQVDARSMHRHGIVDVLVPECPDASSEPAAFSERLAKAIAAGLAQVRQPPADAGDAAARRARRYRAVGLPPDWPT